MKQLYIETPTLIDFEQLVYQLKLLNFNTKTLIDYNKENFVHITNHGVSIKTPEEMFSDPDYNYETNFFVYKITRTKTLHNKIKKLRKYPKNDKIKTIENMNKQLTDEITYLKQQKVLLRESEKFVIDWYETNKYDFNNNLITLISEHTDKQMINWLKSTYNSIEKLINIDHYGYEIQVNNKLYIVQLPNPEATTENKFYLARTNDGRIVIQSSKMNEIKDNWKLTEAEILQNFEWLFPFAKEIK